MASSTSPSAPEGKMTTGYLKKIIGTPVGEMIPLFDKTICIGRTKECEVRIRDPNVSRSHCILNYTDKGWTVTDLGGINGTYLDGDKVVSHVPHPLKDGMGIYLGPPSDAPVAFVFIKSKDAEACSKKAKEATLPSKDVSPQSDNSEELQNTQTNKKKRPNSSNHSTKSKKHAPAPSTYQDEPLDELASIPDPESSSRQQQPDSTFDSPPQPSSSSTSRYKRLIIDSEEDSEGLSDVSICSLDSLRTRIRKMNSHKKKKRTERTRDNSNVASTSASPPLRSTNSNIHSVPSTSSANQAPTVKTKSKTSERAQRSANRNLDSAPSTSSASCAPRTNTRSKASPILKNMKKTNPGAYRELDTLFNDETDSLTDSMNGREDSESLLTSNTLAEHANSAALNQESDDEPQHTNEQDADITLTDKAEQKEKMKEQIKRAKARMKQKEPKEKELEPEPSTSKKDSSDKMCEMLEEELICNICTEVFIKATTLGCSHTFCEHCITTWKKKQKRCPICREVIASETRILIMDNFIDKVVEKLDKDYQDKRKEVIAAREAEKANEKAKKTKRRKGSRSTNSRRSGATRRGGIASYLLPRHAPHQEALRLITERIYPFDYTYGPPISSDSEMEYDEERFCYLCGNRGHYASACPATSVM